MAIDLEIPQNNDLKPVITVFGVGGAGGNAVNNMIASNLEGVKFVVANTDSQALDHSKTDIKLQLGTNATKGLGAGAAPEVGMAAAEESASDIEDLLESANMLFITAGMGGGTGTGAAPVVARLARSMGILTVGVVTKPFNFEGAHRMRVAEQGLEELQKYVDTLIVIPNQNLFRVANERTTFADAFKMADDVLHAGVRGVTDLITMPGLINLDFADIVTVMSKMGKAMMGTGEASGDNRAIVAAEAAISNPLLDHSSMKGAGGVLINITGGVDMTLFEVDEAANRIREEVDNDANIIFGSTFNPNLEGVIRITVVATGIDITKSKHNVALEEHEEEMHSANEESAMNSMEQTLENEENIAESKLAKSSNKSEVLKSEHEEENINVEEENISNNHYLQERAKPATKIQAKVKVDSNVVKKKGFFSRMANSLGFGSDNEEHENQNNNFEQEEVEIPAFLRRKKK